MSKGISAALTSLIHDGFMHVCTCTLECTVRVWMQMCVHLRFPERRLPPHYFIREADVYHEQFTHKQKRISHRMPFLLQVYSIPCLIKVKFNFEPYQH